MEAKYFDSYRGNPYLNIEFYLVYDQWQILTYQYLASKWFASETVCVI